jgi:5'-nucleotidase (lipoprotein e(P4) family)
MEGAGPVRDAILRSSQSAEEFAVASLPRLSALAFTAVMLAACAADKPAELPAAATDQAASAAPAPVPANDNLNATLWMQHSVEYAGSAQSAFALAKIRLDEALKDTRWTAAPAEQTGNFSSLPPAIICDVDETLLDNSAYQAWNVTADTQYTDATWSKFVQAKISTAVPGAVDFANYAASKGVAVYYVTNRNAKDEQATRDNMAKLAFPMGGNVDTFLMAKEQEGWGSAKGSRRAFVAQNHRILLLLGDNFGDFVDAYKGTEADRKKVYDDNASRWGHDWIVLPNPTYGSFEAVPYGFKYDTPPEQMRDAKKKALTPWSGE